MEEKVLKEIKNFPQPKGPAEYPTQQKEDDAFTKAHLCDIQDTETQEKNLKHSEKRNGNEDGIPSFLITTIRAGSL